MDKKCLEAATRSINTIVVIIAVGRNVPFTTWLRRLTPVKKYLLITPQPFSLPQNLNIVTKSIAGHKTSYFEAVYHGFYLST